MQDHPTGEGPRESMSPRRHIHDKSTMVLDCALSQEHNSLYAMFWLAIPVADADAFRSALTRVTHDHQKVDILVNNAGIDLMLPVPGGQDTTVREVFDVNFFAAVTGTLAVAPGMVERGWGIVVNVSSDSARAPEPRQGAYAASKAALSAFSESLAHEMAGRGVHVHVLYPGWVPTAMGLSGAEDGGTKVEAIFVDESGGGECGGELGSGDGDLSIVIGLELAGEGD